MPKDKRGYVIPFFVPKNEDGSPNFKYIDDKKQRLCVLAGLCAICGQSLENDVWYISGPKARVESVSSDPGMHGECARYSLAVCPYLHYAQTHRTSAKGIQERDIDLIDPNKPAQVHLIQATRYSPHFQDGYTLSVYEGIINEEIYTYEAGVLKLVATRR